MGKPILNKFQKRFGDRLSIVYAKRPAAPAEQKIRNEALVNAAIQVITGILRREPLPEEMLGIVQLPVPRRRR